jgi:hypothetical protein
MFDSGIGGDGMPRGGLFRLPGNRGPGRELAGGGGKGNVWHLGTLDSRSTRRI